MGETGLTFGAYRLLERLGKGGMGETWHAVRDDGQGVSKDVVIKRILRSVSDDPSFVEAFIDEARLSARLSHGNIAQVFEFGEVQGECFMALEYVHGQSLAAALIRARERGLRGVPLPFAVYVAMEMLKGLHHAHHRTGADGQPLRIIHRDVSPDNVLLSYEGEVKIVDFGVAKAQLKGRAETEPGLVKGKYLYFSPEQAHADPLDLRTDLFATGIVLYEMLAGRVPVEGQSHVVLQKLVRGELPALGEVAAWVPGSIARVVHKAMSQRREDRYSTALEFQHALASALRDHGPDASQLTVSGLMSWLFGRELSKRGHTVVVPAPVERLVQEHLKEAPLDRVVTAPALPAYVPKQELRAPEPQTAPRAAPKRTLAFISIGVAVALLALAVARVVRDERPDEIPPLVLARAAIERGDLEAARILIADCKRSGPCPGADAMISAAERKTVQDALATTPPAAPPAPAAPAAPTHQHVMLEEVDEMISSGDWERARRELAELEKDPTTMLAAAERLDAMQAQQVNFDGLNTAQVLISKGELDEAQRVLSSVRYSKLLKLRYGQVLDALQQARRDRRQASAARPPSTTALKAEVGQSDVLEVVLSNKSKLQSCVDEQHRRDPDTTGKLVMKWQILADGHVTGVEVVSKEYAGTYMATCTTKLIRSFVFPASKNAGGRIVFPFKF